MESAAPSTAARSRSLPLALGLIVGGALGVGVGMARAQRLLAVEAAERGEELAVERLERRRAAMLGRLADLFEAPLEPDAMLPRITDLFVPEMADVAIVDLLQPDGTLRGAVTSAVDQEIADDLARLRREHPLDPESDHPVAVALRTREAQVLTDASHDVASYADNADHVRHVVGSGYESVLTLPLVARGRAAGTLSFIRRTGRAAFADDEIQLGRDLAPRAALALDNARLFKELRTAEGRMEAIVANLGESVSAFAPDGTLLFANPAAAQLAGHASTDALAVGELSEALHCWAMFDEDGRELTRRDLPVAAALAGGEPAPRLVRSVDRVTGRDLWVLWRAASVLDAQGELEFVVSVGEDLTAVKRQELRERLLSNASKLLGSSLDADATIDKAAWAVVPELADWARVDLTDERGDLRQMAVAHRDLDQVDLLHEWRRDYPPDTSDDRGPAEVLRTGRPVVWDRVDPEDVARYAQAPRHAELMRLIDTRSMLIVPMAVGDRVIGTMQLATTSASGRLLGRGDLDVAEELARRAAIAVENARVHAARTHIATTLQRSLLPPRLPVIPGLSIAARFRAAGTATEVGGDFYDLFEGRDRWMVMMGDVTGKGPGAAAITSLARYTMRTVAQYEDDVPRMLQRLNHTLGGDPDRRQICTAVCVGVRARPDGVGARLDIVCAGHPSPLLIGADGTVRAVGSPGTLLGAFPEGAWTLTELELGASDTLVLYTDGVTDTRGPDDRFGTERLEALLRAIGPEEPDVVAACIDETLLAFGEQRDDVAMLVLQGTAREAPRAAALNAVDVPAA
ncbi:MAG TPA: SpoIIE family protein phosphatase [Baekduia sp.]|uniref:SpoIIE family protein phosphatase n=1 Tax=Baekduia sp. TaxID=2600305 RepID=UPI002BEF1799|nr:SpoIIE family protein phosphatase [Baekduia sp.]HMJ34315.1 SpoIIE family protein phosphatase [Baekduia sp.]